MSDRLSQSEIDELIKVAKVEGLDAVDKYIEKNNKKKKGYQDYDFDRPDKFNLENIKSIESICKVFAKNFSQVLSARFRTHIGIEIASIDQISFIPEYTGLPKDQSVFCITDLGHPELQEIVFELDLKFVLTIHRRALGGSILQDGLERKTLTDFEQVTVRKILENLIYPKLEEAFENVEEIYPRFVSQEYDPEFLRITASTDMVALVTFEIKHENWDSIMRMCIPFNSIEGIIEKLTTENVREFKNNKKQKSFELAIKNGLENVEEVIKVSIGEAKLSYEDLMNLSEGDYIRLENKITNESKGYVADIHRFNCILGRDGIKKAIQITDVLTDKDDEKGEG